MKKKLSFLLLLSVLTTLLIGSVAVSAPPPIEWKLTHGGVLGDYGVKIIQTPDSGFAFLGRTFSYGAGGDDYYLLRLDKDGNSVWDQTYGIPVSADPQDFVWTGDGYIICGWVYPDGPDSSFHTLRVDTAGNEVWSTITGYRGRARDVELFGESDILVAGHTNNPSWSENWPFMVRLNASGDSVWSHVVGVHKSGDYEDMCTLSDGSVVAVGFLSDNGQPGRPYATKVGTDGTVDWSKFISDVDNTYALCATEIMDGTIIVGGFSFQIPGNGTDALLLQINSFGDSTWSLLIPDSLESYVNDVAPTIDGGFVAALTVGSGSPSPHYESVIIKFLPTMLEEWRIVLDSGFEEIHAYSIEQTYEGGFILGAYCDDPDSALNMYAAKIASPFPHLKTFSAEGSNPALHLLTNSPEFVWSSIDPQSIGQLSYEMQIHSDTSWVGPLFWETGQVASQDTSLLYTGPSMGMGELYYVRIRVFNGLKWSPWYQTKIRRNTPPSVPVQSYPIDSTVVETLQPILWFGNGSDAEGDSLVYEIGLIDDGVETVFPTVNEEADSTSITVPLPLAENTTYSWRVRAFDGYEYSNWTVPEYFVVNSLSEAPSAPVCLLPPSYPDSVSSSLSPKFEWSRAIDPDPLDTVYYRLMLSTDSLFQQGFVFDTIADTSFQLGFSLDKFRPYWWKVLAIDNDSNQTISSNVLSFYAGGVWCCNGLTGNMNNDPSENVNLTDLTVLVNYLFVTFQPLTCYGEANTNGDQNCDINLSDVTVLVNYLFVTFQPIANCGDFSICGQD